MVLQFRCSVCEGKFTSKGSWLRHLLEPRHSDLARAELIKNWSGEETRQCLIVAYSKQAVGKDERILQFFSKDRYKGIVTDFVWWKERPGIGFIQFESRKVAKSMIASLDNHQIALDNQQFQFRCADTLLDLEWDNLLPFLPERVDENKDPTPKITERKSSPCKEHPESVKQLSNGTETFKNSTMSRYNSLLQDLLNYVKSQVRTTRINFASTNHAAFRLRHILSEGDTKLIKEGEEVSVSLIRNWCLRLKYHSNKLPFVTVMILNKAEGQLVDYQRQFTAARVANMFRSDALQSRDKKTSTFQISNNHYQNTTSKKIAKSFMEMGVTFAGTVSKGTASGRSAYSVDMILSRNNLLAAETQLWHLAKYLMSFDERCEALMQIVYFWANLNSITVGDPNIAAPRPGSVINLAPDPLGLTWMVLFFLYASDDKFIPSPSEILDGNCHAPIYYGKRGLRNPVDIGFTPDHDFKNAWQKKNGCKIDNLLCPVEIINLVCKFFCFWDGFSEESWVINTREGKYYKSEEFLKLKLAGNDISNKNLLRLQNSLSQRVRNWKQNEETVKHRGILHMSNPFNIVWDIPLYPDALKPFKEMKNKLQVFLNQLETDEVDISKVNSETFVQSLFKIEWKRND